MDKAAESVGVREALENAETHLRAVAKSLRDLPPKGECASADLVDRWADEADAALSRTDEPVAYISQADLNTLNAGGCAAMAPANNWQRKADDTIPLYLSPSPRSEDAIHNAAVRGVSHGLLDILTSTETEPAARIERALLFIATGGVDE